MRKFLIHSMFIGGHRLEYIHHLYIGALAKPDDMFYFVLPPNFRTDSECLDWPFSENIKILQMKDVEIPDSNSGILTKGWRNSKTISNYAKKIGATDIIVISLMEYLPFIPLFLKRKVRLAGIVYHIYLYDWKESSYLHKCLDVAKYYLLTKNRVFYKVLLCNDMVSARYLNKKFGTSKFCGFNDPVASLQYYGGVNIRTELGIENSRIVLLHPGGMDTYKNTIGILNAFLRIDPNTASKYTLILAGRVVDRIKHEFYTLLPQVRKKTQVLFLEGYLPFEKLADLFVTCDFVLAPYKVKSQSSGIIGHAAYYGKPVIAVKGGVIGKMVRDYKLGILLPDSSCDSIANFLSDVDSIKSYSTKGNGYVKSHTVDNFYNSFFI